MADQGGGVVFNAEAADRIASVTKYVEAQYGGPRSRGRDAPRFEMSTVVANSAGLDPSGFYPGTLIVRTVAGRSTVSYESVKLWPLDDTPPQKGHAYACWQIGETSDTPSVPVYAAIVTCCGPAPVCFCTDAYYCVTLSSFGTSADISAENWALFTGTHRLELIGSRSLPGSCQWDWWAYTFVCGGVSSGGTPCGAANIRLTVFADGTANLLVQAQGVLVTGGATGERFLASYTLAGTFNCAGSNVFALSSTRSEFLDGTSATPGNVPSGLPGTITIAAGPCDETPHSSGGGGCVVGTYPTNCAGTASFCFALGGSSYPVSDCTGGAGGYFASNPTVCAVGFGGWLLTFSGGGTPAPPTLTFYNGADVYASYTLCGNMTCDAPSVWALAFGAGITWPASGTLYPGACP